MSKEEIEVELPFIADTLREAGIENVFVRHWGGQVSVNVSNLEAFFREGFEEQNFKTPHRYYIGGSDFEIYNDNFDAEIELCHENHIHVRSSNEAILEKFRSRWSLHKLNPSDPVSEWDWNETETEKLNEA